MTGTVRCGGTGFDEFTASRSLVRYDERGNGLSRLGHAGTVVRGVRRRPRSVVDALGLEQFDLLGDQPGRGGRHRLCRAPPGAGRRLVICNGYAAGWAVRADPAEVARREAMLTLTEVGWGSDNPAYRQLFTTIYIPRREPKQIDWFNEMQRCRPRPRMRSSCSARLSRSTCAIAAEGADADTDLSFARGPGGAVFARRGDRRRNPGGRVRPARKPQPHFARERAGVADVHRSDARVLEGLMILPTISWRWQRAALTEGFLVATKEPLHHAEHGAPPREIARRM